MAAWQPTFNNMADNKEDAPQDPAAASDKEPVRKAKNLREATQHLKEEALRRYQIKHRESLAKNEEEIQKEIDENQSKKSSREASQNKSDPNDDKQDENAAESDNKNSQREVTDKEKSLEDSIPNQISGGNETNDKTDEISDVTEAEAKHESPSVSPVNEQKGSENELAESFEQKGLEQEKSGEKIPTIPGQDSLENAHSTSTTSDGAEAPAADSHTAHSEQGPTGDNAPAGDQQQPTKDGEVKPEEAPAAGTENTDTDSRAPEQKPAEESSETAQNATSGQEADREQETAPTEATNQPQADGNTETKDTAAADSDKVAEEGSEQKTETSGENAEAPKEETTDQEGSQRAEESANAEAKSEDNAKPEENQKDKAEPATGEATGAPGESEKAAAEEGASQPADAPKPTDAPEDQSKGAASGQAQPEEQASKPEEANAPETEAKASTDTEQSQAETEQTPVEGSAPAAEVAPKAEGEESQQKEGEEQKVEEAQQKVQDGEQKPTDGEQKPDADEAKPTEGGPKPDEGEQKPEDQKPAVATEQAATEGGKPADGTEQKPEGAPAGAGAGAEKGEGEDQSVDGLDPNTVGNEREIHSESPTDLDDESKIPENFYYNAVDHFSRPRVMADSGLPMDILTLHHSFGYDCHKRANLHMMDENMTVFAAGNVVELLNLRTREQSYLRSTSGGGIGALAVHPSHKYFAVAEKGVAPSIIIYEYPSLKLYRILRGGTQAAYAYVDYSPDGKLLASVGGDPDYMLTLWDWKNEKIVLRSKAFSQDVFRVTFSSELQGQLTSSGTGHIRFWKMAKTFTGLKLQGLLGKFGKTEISDIEGYVELPDGKVLSGSEWGNMLLWDGGLIKVEIARKGRKPCHNGLIQQIIMDEGELMTIGTDGYIRVWDFETVDTADVTDDTALFEMEPMNELKVGNDVQLKSIVKTVNPEEPTMWYAQDANGGIWKLDLSFSFTSTAPEKLVSYHSGTITGCDSSPVSHLVATAGVDKSVRVYDYVAKSVLCETRFAQQGTSLLWMPKIVDPRGSTILVGFGDGVVRALTLQTVDDVDIHGRKKENVSELVLKQAFKPHNRSVVSMAVDSKGDLLATGSDDKTVFFFNISKTYEPIGFVKIPSAVSHLSWSPAGHKKSTLLVCCVEGEVIEFLSPDEGTFDTSKTFEITGLSNRLHKFKSIKSRLRHEEETFRKAKEMEEKKKKEDEERRIRIERGLETESENGDEDNTEDDDEEEWSPFIPSEPSPILHALYDGADENKVWLSAGAFDAGYLYETQLLSEDEKKTVLADKLYEPTRQLPMLESDDTPVTVLKYSEDRKRLIMGMADGSVRIHPLASGDVGELGPYWILNVHDNHHGSITHIATSFDQKFLFTVGADGNFFTFQVMDTDRLDAQVLENKAKIPSAKKQDGEVRIDDIDDPNAYSIEDAKQKSEHDKMLRLAEEKKAGVKRSIEILRKQFRKLLEKNHELPEHLLLNRKEFEMDPEIKQELERQKQEKIDLVRKEMAWEEEKFSIALEKLRTRFKDIVECERIVVKAFKTKHEVASFRSTKLPDDFYMAKSEMEKRRNTMLSNKDGEFGSRQATQDLLKGQTNLTEGQGEGTGGGVETKEGTKVVTSLKGSMGERINKALAKVEDKKRKRQYRRQQWEELLESKPDDNYEDPGDVLAIKEAQENMGDYKLKSADDYVVPDHLRMNTDKARAKLLVLKDLIHQGKYDFNQNLLSLRDTKIHIIEEIRDIVRQLGEVQANMHPDHIKPLPEIPEMHPEELPERKFEYTRETLIKFKKNKAKDTGDKGGGGGFGGFGGAAASSEASTPAPSATRRSPASGAGEAETAQDGQTEVDESELEKRLKRAEEIRALYVRDQLLKRVEELLKNFDAELRVLRHEKFRLDVNLKNADLRQVTLFEELLLLKDFEKRENVLAAKVNSKMQEKQDMQAKVIEVQSNIAMKKKDIEKLLEKEKALNVQFQMSLGDNNKFSDYLTKVFKKKIKRSKKKATDGDGSDDDSEDESDDDSDWSESEEESESEEGGYDLDACPPGCDQTLYDNTCALREKRLDIEEGLAEEKKNRDTLTKDLDGLNKKVKIIDNALRQAENELEAFQLEKQRKLNELDVVVTLKLHQIQYMINGVLPQDLTPTLVFDANGVTRLVARIKELELEKTSQKKQQKEARKKHIQLNKDRKLFESRIGQMEDVCNKMMLQKFGRVVDLEKLETVTVNRSIEELKEKLRNNEISCSSDLKKWDEKLLEARDYITQLVRENTQRLEQLNMLLCERKEFETALDSRQKNLGGEFTGVRKSDVHERQRLIQLVHLQAQEVEALKEEITLLSRKGGHILPPAQPPMPMQSTSAGPRPPMLPAV